MEIAKLATGGPVVNNEGTEAFRQLVSETGASGGGDAVHVVEPHVHLEGDLHTDGRPLEEAVTVSFREYTRKAASTARRRTRP